MTLAEIKDPPRYHWFCECCQLPMSKWEHVMWHKMFGHPVTDYEWPKVQSQLNLQKGA